MVAVWCFFRLWTGAAVSARTSQEHPYPGVLDASGGAGVLTLDTDGVPALLQVAGLVDDEDAVGVTEPVGGDLAHVVADRVGVPLRPVEQQAIMRWPSSFPREPRSPHERRLPYQGGSNNLVAVSQADFSDVIGNGKEAQRRECAVLDLPLEVDETLLVVDQRRD